MLNCCVLQDGFARIFLDDDGLPVIGKFIELLLCHLNVVI